MNELTQAGLDYARDNYAESIVARVAIAGHGQGWPEAHVDAAIEACNLQGAGERESNRPADEDRAGGRNTLTRRASGDACTPDQAKHVA